MHPDGNRLACPDKTFVIDPIITIADVFVPDDKIYIRYIYFQLGK